GLSLSWSIESPHLERARPTDAADHCDPSGHEQLPAAADHLDGWTTAPVREGAAHLDGIFDGSLGRRRAGGDHDPRQTDVAPSHRSAEERRDPVDGTLYPAWRCHDVCDTDRRSRVSHRAAREDYQPASRCAGTDATAAAVSVSERRRGRRLEAGTGAALHAGR